MGTENPSIARLAGLVLAGWLLGIPVCSAGEDPVLEVFVSILPQTWVVEQIGGKAVNTSVLVGPGQSPATYEPTPLQMAEIEEADLYITVGVPFEKTLLRSIRSRLPDLEIVDGTERLELHAINQEPTGGRDGHNHQLGEPDPHFWLDPILIKEHAATVREALCAASPAQCKTFESKFETLVSTLDATHEKLTRLLAGCQGQEMVAYHSAYGYFARRYGLEVVAAEVGGKKPGPRQLAQMVDRARARGTRAIFVQPQFSARTATALAEAIDAEIVYLDPLRPDIPHNLEVIAASISAALGCK